MFAFSPRGQEVIGPKRAARNLIAQAKGDKQITDKQAWALLWPMIARFRRQIKDKELVAYSAKAMGLSILRKADTMDNLEDRYRAIVTAWEIILGIKEKA